MIIIMAARGQGPSGCCNPWYFSDVLVGGQRAMSALKPGRGEFEADD